MSQLDTTIPPTENRPEIANPVRPSAPVVVPEVVTRPEEHFPEFRFVQSVGLSVVEKEPEALYEHFRLAVREIGLSQGVNEPYDGMDRAAFELADRSTRPFEGVERRRKVDQPECFVEVDFQPAAEELECCRHRPVTEIGADCSPDVLIVGLSESESPHFTKRVQTGRFDDLVDQANNMVEVVSDPLIEILLRRLSRSKKIDRIILATTDGKENDPLVGAVEKIEIDEDVRCTIIGATPAIGICGSGLIDACAKLVECGVMDKTGRFIRKGRDMLPPALQARFIETPDGIEFVLVDKKDAGKDDSVTLTQRDIRQIQLAKSAIYSGIAMLQKIMGVADDDLTELMMCGGFGNYINVENAVKIRLVPELPIDKISYAGNAALMGAQIALISEAERLRASELARQIDHVGLATHPDFQDLFVEGMGFLGGEQEGSDKEPPKGGRSGGRRAAAGGA